MSWLELYHGKQGASITIHPRGKYPGVKCHLDGEEAAEFLAYYEANKKGIAEGELLSFPPKFASKLGKKIAALIEEVPHLLEERTEEQIQEALKGDQEKIAKQLTALDKGKDWKKVK